VRAHPGVQRNASPAQAMGIDQRINFAGKLGLCQRRYDKISLPSLVALGLPVLDCATAAYSKMSAERRYPLRACALDREQAAPVGMTWRSRNFDSFPAERVRYIDVVPAGNRDAVAKVTDVVDDETLNHGARR
jgi:hypothetical protein